MLLDVLLGEQIHYSGGCLRFRRQVTEVVKLAIRNPFDFEPLPQVFDLRNQRAVHRVRCQPLCDPLLEARTSQHLILRRHVSLEIHPAAVVRDVAIWQNLNRLGVDLNHGGGPVKRCG